MSFRNNETTLALAIRSILQQTYGNFEVLLCDDGSTDRSLDVARSFSDSRIVLWSDGKRKYLATRLNECIDRASGPYFARMDADDVCYPRRIERQLDFMLQHPDIDLIGTYAMVFKGPGEPMGSIKCPATHEELTRNPLFGIKLWHNTWLGKTEWFRTNRYNPQCGLAQDQDLLFRAYRNSRYAAVPSILVGYRQDQLDLLKMWKYRVLWLQQRSPYLRGVTGQLRKLALASVLLAKALIDTFAVLSGLNYRVLRHRAMPVSRADIRQWEHVWAQCNCLGRMGSPELPRESVR